MQNWFFFCCLLFSCPIFAQTPNQLMAKQCAACHGKNLQSLDQNLVKDKSKLLKTLLDFKYDKQTVTIMNRISKGFSDEQLKALTDFFSQSH